MGIFDKAKEALGNEEHSDSALDKGAEFAKGKLGDDKAEQVEKVRGQLDDRVGDEQ